MASHHWGRAEVVSSPSHLSRTALILEHYPSLQWRTHAAPWPAEYSLSERALHYAVEDEYCLKLKSSVFPNQVFCRPFPQFLNRRLVNSITSSLIIFQDSVTRSPKL